MSRLLVEAGEALYGAQWQSALARELGVSDRTMRRWVAGTTPVPSAVPSELLRITHDRMQTLHLIERRLAAKLNREGLTP